jgi:hypothetical protein
MEPRDGFAVCPECGRTDAAAVMPLFIVTGASGSGKTTLCVTFDVDWLLDPAGELSGAEPIRWPAFRDAWLAVAHGVAQSGMPTVLLGPLIPQHLDGLPGRRWVGDVHFLLLDCPDELRRDRIQARPSWRGRDIEEQAEFGRWLRRNVADQVDTSAGTPEDTAAAISSWVGEHMTRLP